MIAQSTTFLCSLISRIQSGKRGRSGETRKDCRTRALRLERLEEKRLLTSIGVVAGTTGENPGSAWGAWQIGRSGSADYPCFVSFHLGGTATYGSDYILRDANEEIVSAYSFYNEETLSYGYGGTISIAPGAESATLYLCPLNDAEREYPETATLELVGYFYNGISGAAAGSASITIEDNDASIVSVAATDATAGETSATESNPGLYTISRSGETDTTHALYVSFRMTGSASTSDYALYAEDGTRIRLDSNWDSASETYVCGGGVSIPAGQTSVTVELRPYNDAEREETETAVMTLVPSVDEYGYGAYVVAGSSAQISIEDNDDWTVSVSASGMTTSEEDESGISLLFERSSETDVTHPLAISFLISGSATSSDYELRTTDGVLVSLSSTWDSTNQTTLYSGTISIPA